MQLTYDNIESVTIGCALTRDKFYFPERVERPCEKEFHKALDTLIRLTYHIVNCGREKQDMKAFSQALSNVKSVYDITPIKVWTSAHSKLDDKIESAYSAMPKEDGKLGLSAKVADMALSTIKGTNLILSEIEECGEELYNKITTKYLRVVPQGRDDLSSWKKEGKKILDKAVKTLELISSLCGEALDDSSKKAFEYASSVMGYIQDWRNSLVYCYLTPTEDLYDSLVSAYEQAKQWNELYTGVTKDNPRCDEEEKSSLSNIWEGDQMDLYMAASMK